MARALDHAAEDGDTLADGSSFSRRCTLQGLGQRVNGELVNSLLTYLPEMRGDQNSGDPAVARVRPPRDHSLLFKPVHNAGDRGMSETDLPAQVFEAHTLRPEESPHDAELGWSEPQASGFLFHRLPQDASHLAQVAVEFLRHLPESRFPFHFILAHRSCLPVYQINGIKAFTCC